MKANDKTTISLELSYSEIWKWRKSPSL